MAPVAISIAEVTGRCLTLSLIHLEIFNLVDTINHDSIYMNPLRNLRMKKSKKKPLFQCDKEMVRKQGKFDDAYLYRWT